MITLLLTLTMATDPTQSQLTSLCELQGQQYEQFFAYRQAEIPMDNVRSIIDSVDDKETKDSAYKLMYKAYQQPVYSNERLVNHVLAKELNTLVLNCYSENGLL